MSKNTHTSVLHIIIGGAIGNLNEWYNFLLYGYLAPVISQLFFPTQNKLISLTLTFTVFALSFFVRPLGGILFGWIGDTYGRQRALVLSIIMMTIPTLLIGCLPTYKHIGLWSPILLCVFRICQGLSAGGEHTGSAVYLAEYAPPGRCSFWVSMVPSTVALGLLASSATALILVNSFTPERLLSWGWRMGYAIGVLLCIISLTLRITMPETPIFQKIQKTSLVKRNVLSMLTKQSDARRSLWIVISLASTWGVIYQILFIWMPTYLIQVQHVSNSITLQMNSVYLLIFAGLILLMGYIADFIARKRMLVISCIATIVMAYPLFIMLSSGSLWQAYVAMAVFTLIFSAYVASSFVSMALLFHTQVRYTGLSFGFNMGLAIFGGTCPLIATWLIEITHNPTFPAFYVILAAASALLTTRYIPK